MEMRGGSRWIIRALVDHPRWSPGSTGGSIQGGGTPYSGINAVRPEYNWDDDIPMLSDFA